MASKRLCSRARVSALRASTNGFCGNSGAWTALETGSAEVAGPFGLVLGSFGVTEHHERVFAVLAGYVLLHTVDDLHDASVLPTLGARRLGVISAQAAHVEGLGLITENERHQYFLPPPFFLLLPFLQPMVIAPWLVVVG